VGDSTSQGITVLQAGNTEVTTEQPYYILPS
jgi:hypothetical protein